MNVNVFTQALFWFFAITGMFSLIVDSVNFFCSSLNQREKARVVLTVKNRQDSVESQIRSIVWQYLHKNSIAGVPEIIVVDLGSTDDTPKILERIANDYSFVHITDKDGYIKLIREMT